VFANGTCINQFNMDLHMLFPYATLWSNINLGKGQYEDRPPGSVGTDLQGGGIFRKGELLSYLIVPYIRS
jgi:hypothetical protein